MTENKNEKKWTKALLAPGFTVIPNVLLDRQQALGLDPMDINILLHLAKHWWEADNPPHPSKRAIAECIGVDPSTVQRRIASMEQGGLLQRVSRSSATQGQQTNKYLFDGLIEKAKPFAEEAIAARERVKQETVDRRRRKRPVSPKVED